MKHNTHHKKLNNKIPAWLSFALHDMKGEPKSLDMEVVGANVLHALKKHYEYRKSLGQEIELEPNNYDCVGQYSKCSCPDCFNLKLNN